MTFDVNARMVLERNDALVSVVFVAPLGPHSKIFVTDLDTNRTIAKPNDVYRQRL
jgi:hypothetical protein